MEIRQLKYFVHVAELESFSRAAARLNVAQSALSRHMRLLEGELGVELVRRHGRGAVPTPAGRLFLRKASRILRSLDQTRMEVAALGSSPAGVVNLALPPSISEMFASPILERCERELPNVSLKLFEAWTGLIKEWLLVHRCDLGILYSSQIDDKIDFRPILTEDLCFVVSARLRSMCARNAYPLEEIAQLPLIVPPHPHGLRAVIEAAFSEQGLSPRIAYEAEVWSVIKDVVDSGLAHALISPSELRPEIAEERLVAIPIAKPGIQRTLGFAKSSQRKSLPAVEAVFELISCDAGRLAAH